MTGETAAVDAAFQVRDDVTLTLALEPLGPQVEVEALLLEACSLARVLVGEPCGFALILGATEIPLGDCALVPGPLRALELALRSADLHVREVRLLLGAQFLAPDLDALPAKRRVEALERRVLALVFIFESRAREGREHLARLDALACLHLIADIAGCDSEEGGAHGRDHGALRRDVAHKGPFGHRRDAQPLARDHMLGRAPATDQEGVHEDDDEPCQPCAKPDEAPAIRLRLDRDVLAFGAPNGQIAGGRILTSTGRHQRLQVAYLHHDLLAAHNAATAVPAAVRNPQSVE